VQRGLAILAAAFWLALGATASAQTSPAQSWPTRTVRIVIPLAAGGGGDVFARLLADELQRKYGQPFVVENRPGGGLNIGARACAEAPPDGYTLCVMSSEPVVYNSSCSATCRSIPTRISSRSPICSSTWKRWW
jgi:tripartite-type tricarboxylate transporter receptor subunit TctC